MNYLTPRDVAKQLNIGMTSCYKLFALKGFPYVKIGRKYLVSEEDLNEFLHLYQKSTIYLL